MPQVIDPGPSFGGQLGSAIGQGLSELADAKIAQLRERRSHERTSSALKALNFSEADAKALASLPTEIRTPILSQYYKNLSLPPTAGAQSMASQQPAQQYQQAPQQAPVYQQSPALAALQQQPARQPLSAQQAAENVVRQQQQQQMRQPLDPQQAVINELRQQREPQMGQQLSPQLQQAAQQAQAQAQRPQQQQMAQQQAQQQAPALGSIAEVLRRKEASDQKLTPDQQDWVKANRAAADVLDKLDYVEELLNTGQVAQGVEGYWPTFSQNWETQEFIRTSEELAGDKLAQYGAATNGKIEFARGQKIDVTRDEKANRAAIARLRKDANKNLRRSEHYLPKGYIFPEDSLASITQGQPGQPEAMLQQQGLPQGVNEQRNLAQQQEQQAFAQRGQAQQGAPQQSNQQAAAPQEEGWTDWLVRNVGRPLRQWNQANKEAVLKNIEHHLPEDKKEAFRKMNEERLRPSKYNEPQNFAEEVSDKVLGGLPYLALGGVGIGGQLVRDLGSAITSTAAKKLGFGKTAQVISAIGGARAAGKLVGKAGNLFGNIVKGEKGAGVFRSAKAESEFIKSATRAEKDAYQTARDIGNDINEEARPYARKIAEAEKTMWDSAALNASQKEELGNKFSALLTDVKDNKVNAGKLMDRAQELNSYYRVAPDEAKPYITRVKNIIEDQFKDIGKSKNFAYREFSDARERANYLHGALKYPEQYKKFVEENKGVIGKFLKNPLTYVLSSAGLSLVKGKDIGDIALGTAGGLAVAAPVAAGIKAWNSIRPELALMTKFVLNNDPKVRALTLDVMKNVIKDDGKAAVRAIARLDKATKPYAKLF